MDEPAAWQTIVYGVLPHPVDARILLIAGDQPWSLPRTVFNKQVWGLEAAQPLRDALQQAWGIAVPVLRCAYFHKDEARHALDCVLTLEPAPPGWSVPSGAQWIDRPQLAQAELEQPEHRAVLEQCLDELAGAPLPAQRPPWARPGWFAAANAWIEAEIARLGYELVAPIAYVKTWSISAVLRASTSGGDLYFKQAARLPLFGDEPALTASLSQLFPAHIPRPLAIDRERGWMLLQDFGVPERELSDGADFEKAIRVWSDMQRVSAGLIEPLFAAGCLDRRLAVLTSQIDPLLDDAEARAVISAEDLAELRQLAPRLKAMCGELASCGIPPALVHGDLHWGNIALGVDKIVLFDWTDACVAHPFLDLATLLDLPDDLPDRDTVLVRIRASYLEGWDSYAPPESVAAAAELGEILGALHQAVSYQHIVNNVEASSRFELASGVPYFLGRMLTLLRAYVVRRAEPSNDLEPA